MVARHLTDLEAAMDLGEAIRQLALEKERIERAIAELEELKKTGGAAGGGLVKKRRGRKSMGLEERRQVSKRMSKYWANRRQHQPG